MLHKSPSFTKLIRESAPRIASNNIDDFQRVIDEVRQDWQDIHSRRASFNWDLVSQKLTEALHDIVSPTQEISSHDLLLLHEHLNRVFRTDDNSVACSDACQVALNLAIKVHHDQSRPEFTMKPTVIPEGLAA